MDSSKLILGLATYGRTYTLKYRCPDDNVLGAPDVGNGGRAGPYTKQVGFMAYNEICLLDWSSRVCTKKSSVLAPYGTVDDLFVAYDDQESLIFKVNQIVKKFELGGIMFWALDLDDFKGSCGHGNYPLIKAANAALMDKMALIADDKSHCIDVIDNSCPVVTSSCSGRMPALDDRINCRANLNGLFGSRDEIKLYCRMQCGRDEKCCSQLCCCESRKALLLRGL